MRILGIDPGLRITGYGCVEYPEADSKRTSGSRVANVLKPTARIVEAGVIRLKAGKSVADRLVELDRDLAELIGRVGPGLVAVEKVYAHYKHPTTAIVMGHARGVVLLAARRAGLEVAELGATEVKKSLTGNGHASKGQMQEGIRVQMGLASRPEPADVADALAIALCALRRRSRFA
ncbi:MAG: crossover junction endodeoxyribonuclease RuvC [Phycisphaeraceae bacterium]|nr:crossover junction endodeoxyribonuclease RuvC [Phycisphaeraceae bacterium]